jgi:NAD-dependent dihydropyrimidine dehydrogenase PreA subunit
VEKQDVYEKLGKHLSNLGMAYPYKEDLIEILKENFSPAEAEVALLLPNGVTPMQPVGVEEILNKVDLPRDELVNVLEGLAQRGMLFCGPTDDGHVGYALHQVGFGFPQTFFWKGEDTTHARNMARAMAKYFNRNVTTEAYTSKTKPYRYIPVKQSLEQGIQAVVPYNSMEKIIEDAKRIAVAHCPCRVAYDLVGKGCEHPKDVCMKFNDLARYVIDRGLAKEITKAEAMDVIKRSEAAGLVHFVDNAEGEILHNCNCCGCACWNVGNIRRRKIPRDTLMATYFLRETDKDACIGCGQCVEICPVDALNLEDEIAVVDQEWCIGCGVCATVCPADALKIVARSDKSCDLPAAKVCELHDLILKEREQK